MGVIPFFMSEEEFFQFIFEKDRVKGAYEIDYEMFDWYKDTVAELKELEAEEGFVLESDEVEQDYTFHTITLRWKKNEEQEMMVEWNKRMTGVLAELMLKAQEAYMDGYSMGFSFEIYKGKEHY